MKILKYRYPICIFFSGLILGLFIHYSVMRLQCSQRYSLLNPLLACATEPVINKTNYTTFTISLNRQIDIWKKQGDVSRIGVYFRDLQNGPIFGVNEDEYFVPASLLKLPIALSIFKLAEKNPDILSQSFLMNHVSEEEFQHFTPAKKIQSGQAYSVRELINYSLIYSDNLANIALNRVLQMLNPNKDVIQETLKDLGLNDTTNDLQQNISVRGYSSLFRLLFNSSYLSSESSDEVLGILSQSAFDKGLGAGLPKDIKLANKFGERDTPDGKVELHDCGIIYYPHNPYLLCVMTEGKDDDKLASIISQISKMVYDEVKSREI